MTEIYSSYCKECKCKKEMVITIVSRIRGARLRCLNCHKETGWHNIRNLKEVGGAE
jgi:hypothetical protein